MAADLACGELREAAPAAAYLQNAVVRSDAGILGQCAVFGGLSALEIVRAGRKQRRRIGHAGIEPLLVERVAEIVMCRNVALGPAPGVVVQPVTETLDRIAQPARPGRLRFRRPRHCGRTARGSWSRPGCASRHRRRIRPVRSCRRYRRGAATANCSARFRPAGPGPLPPISTLRPSGMVILSDPCASFETAESTRRAFPGKPRTTSAKLLSSSLIASSPGRAEGWCVAIELPHYL